MSEKAPEVSIIVPVYNAEKGIRRCVDSILTQEFTDFELILMDDGSKDASAEILDEYMAKDPRVVVIHKANSGVSDTRNQGMKLARGKYLQFLDADDWMTKDATKLFYRMAEEKQADLVIANFYRVVSEHLAEKGDITDPEVFDQEKFGKYLMQNPADYYYGVLWNKFFRRDIIEKNNLQMDVTLQWCEDFIFNLEYVLHCNRIFAMQVPVYYYVKTEGSLVQSLNLSNLVRTKLNVAEYYYNFYRKLYDDEDADLKRPGVYRFLFSFARDDSALPIMPDTKKLGDEGIPVRVKDDISENVFTEYYYIRKLLDRYMLSAGSAYGLSLRDVKVLTYLAACSGNPTYIECEDYTGLSWISVRQALQRLAAKRYIRLKKAEEHPWETALTLTAQPATMHILDRRTKQNEAIGLDDYAAEKDQQAKDHLMNLELTKAADDVLKAISIVEKDFNRAVFRGFSDEEKQKIKEMMPRVYRNIKETLL